MVLRIRIQCSMTDSWTFISVTVCRNIRFTDGKDNELIVSREEIGTYDHVL